MVCSRLYSHTVRNLMRESVLIWTLLIGCGNKDTASPDDDPGEEDSELDSEEDSDLDESPEAMSHRARSGRR